MVFVMSHFHLFPTKQQRHIFIESSKKQNREKVGEKCQNKKRKSCPSISPFILGLSNRLRI